ncbi:MAG: glycogen debranching protein GlgX [Candidatus Omnitrophota bacterium]|nr:glycogen debranching protein GlgX [Candidatus Omnitrophota bacterium]
MLKHYTAKRLGEGKNYPLGASLQKDGVNFAVYSKHAEAVYLLLFDKPGGKPADIIEITHKAKYVWYAFVYGLKAGQLYGFKARGPYAPEIGLRFNENKFLIDPCSKAVTGKIVNKDGLLFSYDPDSPLKDLSFDGRDSTGIMPKSIVIDDDFDWQGDRPPGIPPEESVIYETHLKGFTAHPSSRVKKPGTYQGFIEKMPYLMDLGVTAVEFLPLQEFYTEDFLRGKGLANYWGYNTVGFFAPESSYSADPSAGAQVREFKTLVRELHKRGIEVIMDVVYNHSGEGNEMGPTVCFRGIDNPSYYCLKGPDPEPGRFYYNYSGCGNCMNASDPGAIRFILDSLRYWAEVMHVDGFRFDLASILGRKEGEFSGSSSFFSAITQDPVLNRIKLIAEPWDLETYQAGSFPVDWSEWNGKFRDTVRKFVKGDIGQIGDLRYRLTGSPDIYGEDGRTIFNSINFVTCHDGFTLNDLVSYSVKHNEDNPENNNDGTNDNSSWNCGVEGPTDDPVIMKLRRQLAKNYICHLFLSYGTPMMAGGDEFLRTQGGNNNAYCQDNGISWFDWNLADSNSDFLNFCRQMIALVKKHKGLRMRKYHAGYLSPALTAIHYRWFGKDLNEPAWDDPAEKTLALYRSIKEKNGRGHDFFAIFNADPFLQYVRLPPLPDKKRWHRKIDTSLDPGMDFMERDKEAPIDPEGFYIVNPRSTVLLAGL